MTESHGALTLLGGAVDRGGVRAVRGDARRHRRRQRAAALAAAGDPDRVADLTSLRARFESAWVRANILRALASTAAFACLAWALVLHGRAQ